MQNDRRPRLGRAWAWVPAVWTTLAAAQPAAPADAGVPPPVPAAAATAAASAPAQPRSVAWLAQAIPAEPAGSPVLACIESTLSGMTTLVAFRKARTSDEAALAALIGQATDAELVQQRRTELELWRNGRSTGRAGNSHLRWCLAQAAGIALADGRDVPGCLGTLEMLFDVWLGRVVGRSREQAEADLRAAYGARVRALGDLRATVLDVYETPTRGDLNHKARLGLAQCLAGAS